MELKKSFAAIGMLLALCPAGLAATESQDKALEEIRKELAELRKQNQDLQKRLGSVEASPLRSSETLESEILKLNARLATHDGQAGGAEKKQTFTMSGDLRERIEWRSQTNKEDDFRVLSRFTLGMDWAVSDNLKVFAQLRDSRRFGDAGQTEGTAGGGAVEATDDTSPEFHQVYAWMKDVMGTGMNLKVGRQEMVFGKSRVIGNADWGNVGRSFEGFRADGAMGDLSYSIFMMQIFSPTTSTNDHRFWGAYGTLPLDPEHLNMDMYFLYRANDALGADAHLQTVGARAWGKLEMFEYEGELAGQQNAPHDAAADVDFNDAYMAAANVAIGLDALGMDCNPKLTFKYDCGSAAWTELYPTNHARFGQSDFVTTATNRVHYAAILSGELMDGWTLGLEHHWNQAFNQAGSDSVNKEFDISLTGKCSEHLYLGVWVGHVFNDKNGSSTFGAAAPWITPTAGDKSNDASFAVMQFKIPF